MAPQGKAEAAGAAGDIAGAVASVASFLLPYVRLAFGAFSAGDSGDRCAALDGASMSAKSSGCGYRRWREGVANAFGVVDKL